MSVNPNYLRGRDLTAVVLIGQTIGSNGTFTAGTSYTLTSVVDGYDFNSDPVLENLSAVNATAANNVPSEEDSSITVREILRKGDTTASPTCLLNAFARLYDYGQLVVTRGGLTKTFMGSRGSFTEGVNSKGKNTANLTLRRVETGASNPGDA